MNEMVEMLSRMWIECDPNRGGGPGPDDPIATDGQGTMDGQPMWQWFVPRAEASMKFFAKHGYKLVKIDAALSQDETKGQRKRRK